jgi:hypothetical protein
MVKRWLKQQVLGMRIYMYIYRLNHCNYYECIYPLVFLLLKVFRLHDKVRDVSSFCSHNSAFKSFNIERIW